MNNTIMITDAERVILTVNRAFCRSTAYEFSEIVGKTPEILCSDHHPDGFYSEIWQTTRIRGTWQGEMWIRRKSGEAFPVPSSATVKKVRDA
jgi:PAS domain S-box-containing protein